MQFIVPFSFQIITIVVAAVFLSDGVLGQKNSEEFANGSFQETSEAMQQLIRLKLEKNRLALRQDWQPLVTEDERQDQIDEQTKKLLEKGMNPDTAARLAERILRPKLGDSPMSAAFLEIARSAGRNSSGRSGSGNQQTMQFSSKNLAGNAEISNGNIDFSFQERHKPSREFQLSNTVDGQFRFKYSGDDFLIDLKQKIDGSIRIIRVREDETEVFSGQHFLDLRENNPELVDQWLFPLFEHVGFSIPLTPDSPTVQKAVIARLVEFSDSSRSSFRSLLKDLDADDFETRDNATETIMANRDRWSGLIQKHLDSEGLSAEVNARLKNILKEPANESQTEELIRELKLLSSPEYLIGLFDTADEKSIPAIASQLRDLTGEKHSQPPAWRNWLKERKSAKK